MSSRVIEEATYSDVAVRYICGNRAHPGHTVICRFRTENKAGFKDIFTEALVMAQEMDYLKKAGNISVDGTKIHANAGRHSAVSYKRAAEMIAEAEKEAGELLAKAEEADSQPLETGLTIPEEIQRREAEAERATAREKESGEKKRGGGGKEPGSFPGFTMKRNRLLGLWEYHHSGHTIWTLHRPNSIKPCICS
jgi:molybdenum-dependent DNA-binding transcriptional regulator ModE